jgi:LacI family transcriptional regulator
LTSITEVARLAGVSIATASRVVSEADYPVSAQTRERVLDAAKQLDYVPNALARGLLKSQIPVVGVIVHDITDPYFAEVVRGVEDAAESGGYLVITCSSEREGAREASYVRLLRSMRAAGVIFAGSGLDDPASVEELPRHVAALRESGAAVVHLSPHAQGAPEISVDNQDGIASMVEVLADMGHRRIAFMCGPKSLYVARERLAGFRRGMGMAGIKIDENLIVETGFSADAGARAIDELIDKRIMPGPDFTALMCANDLLALGALQRLHEHGISVPRGVSVAGFDDIPVAAMTAPPLTTVRLPLRDMGRLGFEAAIRSLNGETVKPQILPTEVVLRDSTATVPIDRGLL